MDSLVVRKSINIIGQDSVYQGFFHVEKFKFQHSLFQGGDSVAIEREVMGRGQAVVVLLYDLARQYVVLVEQCRAGALPYVKEAQDSAQQAWLIEPVAGMIDQGETAQQACQREVVEEAGVALTEFEYVCQFYPSPGGCSEILHLYGAQVNVECLGEFGGLAQDVEDIRLVKLPFAEAKSRLLAGKFDVASTIIALQWLFFQRLAQQQDAPC